MNDYSDYKVDDNKSDAYYDHNVKYPDDKSFNIDGKTLNSISKTILFLEKEVDKKDTELKDKEKEGLINELEELRMRDKNPTLKDAWDQYNVVLELTRKR